MQSLTLHGHPGPNPWKVALVLEELSLPYKMKIWTTPEQKKPPFTTTLNPNGFTPVIEDPNTGIKLWESGAIVEYLLETYDINHFISFPLSSVHDRGLFHQYHYFQATFQGPNLSAALYFTNAAPNAEARKRYVTESIRVLGVLENALGGDGLEKRREWLVGTKCTAADLAFAPYILMSMDFILGADKPDITKEYPNVSGWMERMAKRPSVQKVLADRKEAVASLSAPKVGTN